MYTTLLTRVIGLLRAVIGALLSRRPAVLADEQLISSLTPSNPADAELALSLAAWRAEVQR